MKCCKDCKNYAPEEAKQYTFIEAVHKAFDDRGVVLHSVSGFVTMMVPYGGDFLRNINGDAFMTEINDVTSMWVVVEALNDNHN